MNENDTARDAITVLTEYVFGTISQDPMAGRKAEMAAAPPPAVVLASPRGRRFRVSVEEVAPP